MTLADDHHLEELARQVSGLLPGARPVLFGIAGGVAVGKSTVAEAIHRLLAASSVRVDVVCTDSFLRPNAELARLGLTMQKGFPATFDHDAIDACLRSLKAGDATVRVPVYSHDVYDRVEGATHTLERPDVVIVEGVNVLQPPAVDRLDLSVYIDAEEADMRSWFVGRFLSLCEGAGASERSFYRGFLALTPDERRGIAESAWDGINGVNLRDHIGPSRSRATFVLEKAHDHGLRGLRRHAGTRGEG